MENKRYYVRIDQESQSAMMQRHYGSFFKTVSDAMASAEKYLGNGHLVEVVDQLGKVYLSTGALVPERY